MKKNLNQRIAAVAILGVVGVSVSASCSKFSRLKQSGSSRDDAPESIRAGIVDEPRTMIFSFDAKGTAMAFDAGVMKAVYQRLDQTKIDRFVYAGSSSGSLMASYFACHGLNDSSIQQIDRNAATLSKDLLSEHTAAKLGQIILGVNPEVPATNAKDVIDTVTDKRRCIPNQPMVIAAGNLEINDQRGSGPLGSKGTKRVDIANYDVYEGANKLGKTCTYFVDQSMHDVLAKMNPQERLCDLRLMKTSDDLVNAILASISEPTYFAPTKENHPELIESVYGPVSSRTYNGGYVMVSVIQDLKRSMPNAYSFGTGRFPFSRVQDRIVKNWFTVEMNRGSLQSAWWLDAQVPMTQQQWADLDKITVPEQVALGERQGVACLSNSANCHTVFQAKPAVFSSADGSIADMTAQVGRGLDAALH